MALNDFDAASRQLVESVQASIDAALTAEQRLLLASGDWKSCYDSTTVADSFYVQWWLEPKTV